MLGLFLPEGAIDKVAVASLNATILAIYEAVLVVAVARMFAMREGLDRLTRRATTIANRLQRHTHGFDGLRQTFARPVVSWIPQEGDEQERLLEMLLRPEAVLRDAQSDANLDELVRQSRLLREVQLRLILEIKRDVAAGKQLRELYPELSERFLTEAKGISEIEARREHEALLSDSSLRVPPEPDVPELPDSDADRGMILAALLAGFMCEPPFAPVPLSDEGAIDQWLGSAHRLGRVRRLLDNHRDGAEALLGAAVAQQEGQIDDENPRAVTDYDRSRLEVLNSLLRGVTAILGEVARFEAELTEGLRAYRRDRPAAWVRAWLGIRVAFGLIGGAVVFVAGVVGPILWAKCPKALYTWVPGVWYCIVLAVVCVSVTREARRLFSSL